MREPRLPNDATFLAVGRLDAKCWTVAIERRIQRIASRKTAELLELSAKLVNHRDRTTGRQIGIRFDEVIRTVASTLLLLNNALISVPVVQLARMTKFVSIVKESRTTSTLACSVTGALLNALLSYCSAHATY